MSDVLKEWLIHQLGLEVRPFHPDNICGKFQNGFLIGKILQSYNVVNSSDVLLLVDGKDEETKISNFRYVSVWLNAIKISLDSDTVNGIISGQRSVTFAFLYRLCFTLESPNNLNLTRHAIQVYNSFGSFDFLGISDTREQIYTPKPKHGILMPFYYDDKYIDQNALSFFETSNEENLTALYGEINNFEHSLPEKLKSWSTRGDQTDIRRFLSDIKFREQHSKIYDSWRTETLNNNSDVKYRRNQEVLRNKSMPDKLIYMSKYEQLMLDKIINARFIIKKRNAIFVKNELQFINEYNVEHDDYMKISDELRSQIKEESIERNMRQTNIENTKIMKTIVCDLVDLSVKIGCHNKQHDGNVIAKYMWDNWIEMFVEGRPLLNGLDDKLGLLLDPQFVYDNKPRSDEELKTQTILNRKDLKQYLQSVESWSEHGLNLKNKYDPFRSSRILGFYVYDVLTSLYALPASLVDIDDSITLSPVKGVFNGEIGKSSTDRLCDALVSRNILPILMETALRYCLYAYCRETDNKELIKILEENNNIPTLDLDKNFKNAIEHSLNMNIKTLNDFDQTKQTQTPEKIIKHYDSERIQCGKIVFVNIYNGKPIPKYCLIDCVLAYMKSNIMLQGFVLIGFPREELMIIEERLAKKHYPPYGSYAYMKNNILSIMVPFKGPDLGDEGRYRTSLSNYLKILSSENPLNEKFDDTCKYYKSQKVLTLLQITEKNLNFDSRKIKLFCDVLAGEIVDWNEEIDWINCVYNTQSIVSDLLKTDSLKTDFPKIDSLISSKLQNTIPKRERRHGKSEFDFIDQLTAIKSDMFTNTMFGSIQNIPNTVIEVESAMFNVQLSGNIGVIFGNFWKVLENEFIEKMEKCLFHIRLLLSEQESYVFLISKYMKEILCKENIKKLELIKRLQTDLYNIPTYALEIPDVTRQSLLVVSDAKVILIQSTNQKIDKCKQYVQNDNTESWLEKQCNSMMMVYKCILQTEIDRTVNILRFINSYMSKLYNQEIPISIIPKQIEVSLNKNIPSKMNVVQNSNKNSENVKKFIGTVQLFAGKVKAIFTTTSEWLEETKEANNMKSLENLNSVYLKIWKSLVEAENWRSAYQLKLIAARFQTDIKEMESVFFEYRSNINQRIDNRLQHELIGIERICNLFETAIQERRVVRNEIILDDDYFYLNPENILNPKHQPSQPFPLLEPDDDLCVVKVADLEIVTNQLCTICPDRRIPIIYFSNWLTNSVKYFPQIDSFNMTTLVLRSMFGFNVNYIDWTDFVMHCLELTYPGINDLLDLKKQYARQKKIQEKNSDQIHVEGTIDRDGFDSVLLWYEKKLPSSPSIYLRDLKIKDLLFMIFSTDDGKFDYIAMLLALCKDNNSTTGLIKAISLLTDQNILDRQDISAADDDHLNKNHCLKLPMETVYNTLIICLKNYMAPDQSDIKELVSSLLNVSNSGDGCDSMLDLFKNDIIKSLSETGHRFNSRSLSNIFKNLK
ncbi:Hypothetical protein CINCED_3A004966 [Cinara cedri]|uniref:Uncharacterized protein n=1 Tax=Cinara cedri TaxID=506608 RepID=A0A5E4M5M0_9HEMI|nr:Hypothetical protein CINCED_3A004966 [Cinara cedri]